MDKRLKIGLWLMLAAVVIMPFAFLFKDMHPSLTLGILLFTMLLELAGMVFVILNLVKNRRS